MIVAIDGVAGAGKTSTARQVAKHLGFSMLDTGAIYRSVAYYAIESGVSLDDSKGLAEIAADMPLDFDENGNLLIDGTDATAKIRNTAIDSAVTPVSACTEVRKVLLPRQRKIATGGNWVVEGRDIGTVVFPDAEVKVFLTARDEIRGQRRLKQDELENGDAELVLGDLRRRDDADTSRTAAPLKQAEDAYLLDNTDLSLQETAMFICGFAEHAMRFGRAAKTQKPTPKTYKPSSYQSLYTDGLLVVPACGACGEELPIINARGEVGKFCCSCGQPISNPTDAPDFECATYSDEIIGLCYVIYDQECIR